MLQSNTWAQSYVLLKFGNVGSISLYLCINGYMKEIWSCVASSSCVLNRYYLNYCTVCLGYSGM